MGMKTPKFGSLTVATLTKAQSEAESECWSLPALGGKNWCLKASMAF